MNRCQAANFPPLARASAMPLEAQTGQAIEFSSDDSIDPDGQPAPLSFFWDFGDGDISSSPEPVHSYTEAGAYRVSLTVDDGADSSVAFVTVFILAPTLPEQPSSSSLLALSPNNRWLWIINPDSDSVTVFDAMTSPPTLIEELVAGRNPRTIAFNSTGTRAYVTCQARHEVLVFEAASRQLLQTVPVGHQPYGVAVSSTDDRILISNQGDGTIHILNANLETQRILQVSDSPRAIAVTADGQRAYSSHFLTRGEVGMITEIDLNRNEVSRIIPLLEDPGPDTPSSGRGYPNLLSSLAIEPSGRGLWVGGLKSNTGRGLYRNALPLTPENTVRGFIGRIDMAAGAEQMDRRIDINNGDSVSALAFSPNGRFAYAAHQGVGMVSVYDLTAATLIPPGDGSVVPFIARIDSGHAPQGIVVTRDGMRGFVANYLSRDVSVLDLANPTNPVVQATTPTTIEPLPADVANGKRLFYRSRAPRHSRDNYIACASCHADGSGHDGRTWDFTQRGEGLRNTTNLRGRAGLAHGPVHWTANFDEIQDFENDIVKEFGGTGLAEDGQPPHPPLGEPNSGRSSDLDDLAAYVSSLSESEPSPWRRYDGSLDDAAQRGKVLFESPALGCIDCHSPPRLTDSTLTPSPADYIFHDVGTLTSASGQRLDESLTGLDTPSLIGLWQGAPYLHDGSAETIMDVLTTRNLAGLHGTTGDLTSTELADLERYLLCLDGTDDDLPLDSDGDGMTDRWELRFGLSPNNGLDADEDADGDGVTNRDEFLAGTDPSEPLSYLFIRSLKPTEAGPLVSFPTRPKFSYTIESAEQPRGPWMPFETIVGDGTERQILDTNITLDQKFYRLRLNTVQSEILRP